MCFSDLLTLDLFQIKFCAKKHQEDSIKPLSNLHQRNQFWIKQKHQLSKSTNDASGLFQNITYYSSLWFNTFFAENQQFPDPANQQCPDPANQPKSTHKHDLITTQSTPK